MYYVVWFVLVVILAATSAAIVVVRKTTSGWYFVAYGLITAAAGVIWSYSLAEHELLHVLLEVLRSFDTWLGQLLVDLGVAAPTFSFFAWTQLDVLLEKIRVWLVQLPVLLASSALLLVYVLFTRVMGWPLAAFLSRLAMIPLNRTFRTGASDDNDRLTWTQMIDALNTRVADSSSIESLKLLLIVALSFLFMSIITEHGSFFKDFPSWNPFELHRKVFCLGSYIFLAEILGQLWKLKRHIPPSQAVVNRTPPTAVIGKREKLLPFFLDVLKRHSPQNQVLHFEQGHERSNGQLESRELHGNPLAMLTSTQHGRFALRRIAALLHRRGQFESRIISNSVAKFEGLLDGKNDLIIHEPLHPLHLHIIFALCEHQQAQGRLSLIICPDRYVRYVEAILEECASQSLASRVQTHAILGGVDGSNRAVATSAVQEDRSYSYVIVSDRNIEQELLGPHRGVAYLLDNLGLIVALQAQDLEISVLRLQLTRLWLRVPRSKVSVIVQVGRIENYRSLAQALFPLEGPGEYDELTLGLGGLTTSHCLVWNATRDTANDMMAHYAPALKSFSTEIGLIGQASSGGETSRLFPTSLGINQSEIIRAQQYAVEARSSANGTTLDGVFDRAAAPDHDRVKDARVVIVKDRTSLLKIMGEFYDAYFQGEILLHVASHDYPLRAYHVSRLAQADRDIDLLRNGTELAPNPRSGIRELLFALYEAMQARRPNGQDIGLYRSEILARFVNRLPPRLIERLEFIPGRDGLQRLFATLGVQTTINIQTGTNDTLYRIDRGEDTQIQALAFRLQVFLDGVPRPHYISAADIGLTVLHDQIILIGGIEHQIKGITATHIDAEPSHTRRDGALTEMSPVLEYRFLCENHAPSEGEPASTGYQTSNLTIWDGATAAPPGWLKESGRADGVLDTTHYYAHFERRTVAKIEYAGDLPPLHPENNQFSGTILSGEKRIRRQFHYQSVWHLRLSQWAEIPEEDVARLSFTMAVVLQDVVQSLFPRWAHRLYVVSPSAAPVFENGRQSLTNLKRLLDPQQQINNYLAYHYPRLILDRPAGAALPVEKPTHLDIFLIEDSDIDLGIVRALAGHSERLFSEAIGYLNWVIGQNSGASIFHRFGGSADSDLLLYGAALNTLQPIPHSVVST